MRIREKIVDLMDEENYRPMHKEELASLFDLNRSGRKTFYSILDSLESEGRIIKTNDNKYNSINEEYLVVGEVQGNERGFGFVISDDKERDDIFIPKDYLNSAMHGDRVIANIVNKATPNRREEGEIIKILERANDTIVGTFQESKNFGFVIADEDKLGYDVFIPKGKILNAKNNQKVVAKITKWPEDGRNPEGRIVEVLGYLSEKGTDILSVIRQYDLPEEFPEEVLNHVDNINQEVTEEDIDSRVDLRDENIFTIDGADAKDLDDAISIDKLDNGNYRLGVHIADVTHYVADNSVLDEDALNRGNSVYLIDRVIPMLPEELSNGICSLNPGEDRLCLSIIMEIDKSGNVMDNIIQETVINSKKRLVYDDVSDFLEDGNKEAERKLKGVTYELKLMEELAEILREKRHRRGSIDFDFPETRIVLDENGKPVDIQEEERRVANRLIEEFMLISNETVSEQFYWADIPFLYRVHEEPSPEKIDEFKKVIHNLGYSIKGEKEIHPKDLQMLLEEVKGKKEESLISMLMLRSLKKAVYSEETGIHFGLSAQYYSHFTAPIRRYPDLTIHRIIKDYINGNLTENKMRKLEKTLPEIADHTSKTERRAEEAERSVDDMKKAEYMLQFIGEEFDGIISSLTGFGIFVQLDNTIEGLVRFSEMKDDFYDFDQENYIVIGQRGGNIYRLGDKVRIMVTNASVEKRNIDFIFVD